MYDVLPLHFIESSWIIMQKICSDILALNTFYNLVFRQHCNIGTYVTFRELIEFGNGSFFLWYIIIATVDGVVWLNEEHRNVEQVSALYSI